MKSIDEEVDLLSKFKKAKHQGHSTFILKFRFNAYSMISRMIDQNKNFQNVTYGLKLAEFIQILYLVISPDLAFMWRSSVLTYITIVCQYLNWSKINSEDQDSVLFAVFSFNCMILVLWFSLLALFIFSKQKLITLRSVLVALLSGYSTIFNSLLVLPMATLSFNVCFCVAQDVNTWLCQGKRWTLARTLAILNILLICLQSWMFEFNHIDLNPLTNSVFSTFWHRYLVVSQLRKVVLSLLFTSLGLVLFFNLVVID